VESDNSRGAGPFKPLLSVGLLAGPPIVCLGLGLPHGGVVAIFLSIVGLWMTEAIPLAVTGLLVPVLAVMYGVLPAAQAFNSFGSDILFLFLGCFLLARSMEKHGFDRRLAYIILSRCVPGNSFFGVNLIIALTAFVLSMWISNTSATAIMVAITLGVLSSLTPQLGDEVTRQRAATRLLLTCAFAASVGGLATPVGSPPNLIALRMLGERGISLSFLEWLMVGLPIGLVMLGGLLLVLARCFPLRGLTFPGVKDEFRRELAILGPMNGGERQVAIVFLVVILLWVVPGLVGAIYPELPGVTAVNSRFSMAVVGLLGGLSLFFLPVRAGAERRANIDWAESERIDWGTIMLFGGGLTLGVILEQSGAAKDFGELLFGGGYGHPLVLGAVVVIVAILMSELASNTAAAAILIPLLLGATIDNGGDPGTATSLVFAATFGASFGFMLPVSTPPNAIVYGTGQVAAGEMRRAGVWFDLLGAFLLVGWLALTGAGRG